MFIIDVYIITISKVYNNAITYYLLSEKACSKSTLFGLSHSIVQMYLKFYTLLQNVMEHYNIHEKIFKNISYIYSVLVCQYS